MDNLEETINELFDKVKQQEKDCEEGVQDYSMMSFSYAIGEYRMCPFDNESCKYCQVIEYDGQFGKIENLYRCNKK